MELDYKNKILDDLFEIREERLRRNYIKQKGKPKISKNSERAEEELVEFMKKFIKDESDMKKLVKKINNFESEALDEMCFWYKPYYQLGFIDGMSLERERKEKKFTDNIANETQESKDTFSENEANDINENSFFYKYMDSIMQFLEDNRFNNWRKRNDYKAITDKMVTVKNKYPNVRTFLDDKVVIELTTEELQAVLEYISLEEDIEKIEKIETFKLGVKEGNLL